jgi:undecaprenyl pyrophosphate synthase
LSDAVRSRSEAAQPLPAGGDGFAVPRHVAIIMDGNGRWAAAHGLPRVEGHRRGVEALRRTVRAAGELGISVLTIFSFSSGELVASALGDPRSHGPAAPLYPQRPCRSAQEQRAGAHHRRA